MPPADLALILEAGGLAPSAFNYQPWHFLYAYRETPDWDTFLRLLLPFNAAWAKEAAVLIFVLSDTMMRDGSKSEISHSHSFDAGAAWAMLSLQAMTMGYYTHGMTGVDFACAREQLRVPRDFRIEAAVAVGRRAPAQRLDEKLKAREWPSGRKALQEIATEGVFKKAIE